MCANRRNHVGGDLTWVDATPLPFTPPVLLPLFTNLLFCPQFNEEVTGSTKLISFPQYSVKKMAASRKRWTGPNTLGPTISKVGGTHRVATHIG